MTNNNLNLNNNSIEGEDKTMTNNNETMLNNKSKLGDDKLMLNELKELNRTYEYLQELEAMYELDNIDEDKHDMIYNIFYDKYTSLMNSIRNNISDDKKLTKLNDKYVVLDIKWISLDTLEFDLDDYRSINDRYEINCIGIIRNKSTKYVLKPKVYELDGYIFHDVKSFRRETNNYLVGKLFYDDSYVVYFDKDVIEYVLDEYEKQTAYNAYKSFKDSKEGAHVEEYYSQDALEDYFDGISSFTCESIEELVFIKFKIYKLHMDEIVKYCSKPEAETTFTEVKKLIKRFNFEMKLTSDYNTTVTEFAKLYKDYIRSNKSNIAKQFIFIRELSLNIKDILSELDTNTTFALLRKMSREMFYFDMDTYYSIFDSHCKVREDRKLDYITDYLIDEYELACIFGWEDNYYY